MSQKFACPTTVVSRALSFLSKRKLGEELSSRVFHAAVERGDEKPKAKLTMTVGDLPG